MGIGPWFRTCKLQPLRTGGTARQSHVRDVRTARIEKAAKI